MKKNNIHINLSLAEKARRNHEIELYGKLLSLRPSRVHKLKNKYNRKKAKAEMKKMMILGAVAFTMLVASCGDNLPKVTTSKESDKLDSLYKHSVVYDKEGHTYDLYENGEKFGESYSFQLIHRTDCKKCLDMFD